MSIEGNHATTISKKGEIKRFLLQKRVWLTAIIVIVFLCAIYLGGGYVVYSRLAKISPTPIADLSNNPTSFKVTDLRWEAFDTSPYFMSSYEVVTFPSRQENIELSLSGWYVEVDPKAPVVIVTHGINSSKKDGKLLVPAGMLAKNGFNVLLYDLRNHGESDKDNGRTSAGNKEYQDILGAWDYLVKEKGYSPDRIGLYSVSLGAGTTLIAFGQEHLLAAAFVDSPFFNLPEIIRTELAKNHYPTILATAVFLVSDIMGDNFLAHSPADAISMDNNRPIYVVHGTGDTRISVNQTYELEELAREKGANVTVWITDGIEHVGSEFAFPIEYEQRLVDFFETALK